MNTPLSPIKKNDGFSIIEGLLIILIVSVLAIAGFFVYKDHQKSKSSTLTNNYTNSQSPSTVATTDNVITYTSFSSVPNNLKAEVLSVENQGGIPTSNSTCEGPHALPVTIGHAIISPNLSLFIERDNKYMVLTLTCSYTTFPLVAAYTSSGWKIIEYDIGGEYGYCPTLYKYSVPIDILKASQVFTSPPSPYMCSGSKYSTDPEVYYGPATQ